MQCEIDELRRELRHARRRRSSPSSEPSSEETDGASYRRRSRTPPSETFSYEEEHHHRRRYKSPPCKGLGNDAMNKALSQVSKSPFTRNIEDASLPWRFHQPTFTIYNGRINPVEHVSHFSQRMAVHSKDEALMVPQPLGSLLSMSLWEGETLKAYSDRYWEIFNEIEGEYDDVAINTFKASLPAKHDLRKSLTGKPVTSVRQLMDRIDKYRRVEEDQLQGKGKAKVIPRGRRDFRSDRYNNNRPRKDFVGQSGSTNTQAVNAVF
ncbi:uncharacterized protein LOC126707163 [Quercus robur]|uniref:uncharacterized protein LOC126707163 n=1 Tax=Quercus robur TaxID=38942 RepID=UPI0021628ABD|nr:uncharacterized protein LOC126707163 [Quercus robur]